MSPISYSRILAPTRSSSSASLMAERRRALAGFVLFIVSPVSRCWRKATGLGCRSRRELLLGRKRGWVFFLRRSREVIKVLAPRHVPRQQISEAINVREVIPFGVAHQMRRFCAALKRLDDIQQTLAHRDNRFVTDAEVFFAAVEDCAHAFCGAGVVIEKVFYASEVNRPLHVSVLQVVVACVANAAVVRADLFPPVNFFL